MAVTKTADEVINGAARDIRAIEPGESLSPEDYEAISIKYDGLIDLLGGLNVYIDDKDSVDTALFLPLTRMLGNVAGAPVVAAPLNDEAWNRDLRLLQRLTATKPTFETLKAKYF